MENIKYPTSTFDLTVMELCEQVDYWKSKAQHFQDLYKKEREAHWETNREHMSFVQQGVADALMLCLNIKEDGHGNILIDKEGRKDLVEYHSKKLNK